jgi:hypothetical protein
VTFARLDKESARTQMGALVARYSQQADELGAPGSTYPESQARLDFIDEFFRIFGWDIRNEDGLPQSDRRVVVEQYIDLADEESSGRPDYTFRQGRQPRLVVEAKRPAVPIRTRSSAALQARTYGWSMSVPAAVLTNFADTIFYDATVEPEITDNAEIAALPGLSVHYSDYVARFDDLWDRLAHEVLTSDRFFAAYAYEEPPRGASDFDRAFLRQFSDWRLRLARDIAHRNPSLSAAEVGRRAQRLLNALLFLRICEDRRIEIYRDLLSSAETNALMARFARADAAYNAGLFSLLATTGVSDDALLVVVRQMYWPVSKYAFGVLQPEVLAGIYEQSLAERVVIDGKQVRLERKPEVTHASGIVPTPLYIVENLTKRGFGDQLDTHNWSSETPLRILDMSLGSGIFLLAAFRTVVSAWESQHGATAVADRAALAQAHLFGVDIDGEAVEVARLSLLLAVLGDEALDSTTARGILPNLSANLVVGNSLIDHRFDEYFPRAAQDPQRRAAVRPFEWAAAFSDVVGVGGPGFDVIVGNPPYIRIQELALHFPDQLLAFQSPVFGYKSARHSFDVYMLFIERALGLLNKDTGRLAMIVPQRFSTLPVARPLRSLLAPVTEEIVHFGTQQIFANRTTYSSLLIASMACDSDVLVEAVNDLPAWRAGGEGAVRVLARRSLGAAPWLLADEVQAAIFEKMQRVTERRLHDEVDIFVGAQTSADEYLSLLPTATSSDEIAFTDPDGKDWVVERSMTRPTLKDRRLIPYDHNPYPDRFSLFPYKMGEGRAGSPRAERLSPEELEAAAPLAFRYLTHHKERLLQRDIKPAPGDHFYAFGRNQSLHKMDSPKIVVRVMSIIPQYAWDTSGLLSLGGATGGPYYNMRSLPESTYPYQAVIAVLSHPASEALLAQTAPINRGGYVSHRKQEMQFLPLPDFDSETLTRLIAHVDELHATAVSARALDEPDLVSAAQERRLWVRNQVDRLVSDAFELTPEEIEAIAP